MKRLFLRYKVVLTLICAFSSLVNAQSSLIIINVNEHGALISPLQYGIFYEEFERAGDGGLYAEMIENRSFEEFRNGAEFENRLDRGIISVMDDPKNIEAWELRGNGKMSLDQSKPLNGNNPTSLRVESNGNVSIINAGFLPADQKDGLGVGLACRRDEALELSFYARDTGNFDGKLVAVLEGKDGTILAKGKIEGITTDWKKFRIELLPNNTDVHSRLVLNAESKGTFWLDMVSLFPKDTFKNRPNGLRKDLAEMLAALKPSFVRFPGGCFVEGLYQLKEAWNPIQTLGNVSQRPELPGARWQYGSTNGFGYYEMLQMCEDLDAKPLLVINAGMSHGDEAIVRYDDSGAQFPGFLNEALNAIEYANDAVSSTWGSKRVLDGHPAPFNLKYIEIGNEDEGFPSYEKRFDIFYKKIKEKYPYMDIISNGQLTKNYAQELIDEHYYPSVGWCLDNFHKYDSYKRNGTKIFVGEFGVTQDSIYETSDMNLNNLKTALGEAVFWLGAERNSDVVAMTSFAPLLCRLDQKMWRSNLIYFDQAKVFGSPSYYIIKMLSNNRGDYNVKVKSKSLPFIINTEIPGKLPFYSNYKFSESIYAGATLDEKTNEVILKVVNFLPQPQKTTINLKGVKKALGNASLEILTNKNIAASNSFAQPLNVSPIYERITNISDTFTYEFKPNSFTIVRIPIEISK
ncbi:MAG: alpha-L-arabinofuranosidase C-terminal domain-containing protein [Ignavibacteriaceae bacterium]